MRVGGEGGKGEREGGRERRGAISGCEWDAPALSSSLSFLISLKERRSVECKRTNPGAGQGERGHQGTHMAPCRPLRGGGAAKSPVRDTRPEIEWGHPGYLGRTPAGSLTASPMALGRPCPHPPPPHTHSQKFLSSFLSLFEFLQLILDSRGSGCVLPSFRFKVCLFLCMYRIFSFLLAFVVDPS